ncbi:hypothetical protein N4R57_12885 [Rhodobacteraceae bacterium D3-12]|nr:hypothetical protein N4R57_12885 [Rhodobacteraceae bacterium D3-12]
MAKGFSLADQLFNPEKLGYLAGLFASAVPGFERVAFEREVLSRLGELELKARIDWIAECLDRALPGAFEPLAEAIVAALPAPCDPTLSDDDFGDFIFAPLGELVVRRGIDAPERSLDVLEEVTQRFSMEYAIRPFLNACEDAVFDRLEGWSRHPHYHVRRLVSEGTRPKLPWGKKINADPARALGLLDVLHADGTRFVTRSVANHMNDLSRMMPGVVMDRLEAWGAAGKQNARELAWMRKHALRTLVKQGDARAMAMLGYRADAPVTLKTLTLDRARVPVGEQITFEVTLSAAERTPVLVDYLLEFHRGQALAPRRKVMKLGQGVVDPGKPLRFTKRYRIPRDATTVKIVPGPHRVSIQVNGQVLGGIDFEVV